MPRADPLSVCAAAAACAGAGARDPLQRQRGLARENLQNFPLETAVAKRHALEMSLDRCVVDLCSRAGKRHSV